jgi:hypothetical protein
MAQNYEEMDAIAMLKADHRKVEDLFEKFEQTNGKATKQQLAEQICLELKVHTVIEEEIFYPACRGKIEDDLVNEAYVEHDSAKLLINEIEAGGPDEQFYDAKVKVLSERRRRSARKACSARPGRPAWTWTCWPTRCAPANAPPWRSSRLASPRRPGPWKGTTSRAP